MEKSDDGPLNLSTAGYSDEERLREAQKAAQSSLEAQQRAHELTQAVMGAGDPEVRQKLLQEALNKEIEAESFGKLAKWIQSGAVQGFIRGTVPGITLGALTGILVGGVVSLVTGTIGAGIGALQGPTWKLGDLVGQGIRSITGDLPGWKATVEQEESLRSMVLDVHKQPMPSKSDLEAISDSRLGVSSRGVKGQSWGQYASSYIPSFGRKSSEAKAETRRAEHPRAKNADALRARMAQTETNDQNPGHSSSPNRRPAFSTQRSGTATRPSKQNATGTTQTAEQTHNPRPSSSRPAQQKSDPESPPAQTSSKSGNHKTKSARAGPQPSKSSAVQAEQGQSVRRSPRKIEVRAGVQ